MQWHPNGEIKLAVCEKCHHEKPEHRDDICYGDRFCLCIKFEEMVKIVKEIGINNPSEQIIQSRTDTPLPMFITTHDNWSGKGWQYQKKWGKTQSEMVEFLALRCKLNKDEIRIFLRCKAASVRGRLSEINSKQNLQVNNY